MVKPKTGEKKNPTQEFQDLVGSDKSAEELEKELTPEEEKKDEVPEDGGAPVTPEPEVKPEEKPEEKPEKDEDNKPLSPQDKQVAGLIRELQEDRKTMKELKTRLEEQQDISTNQAETIAYLQGQMDKKVAEKKSVLDEIPDDEPMTAGTFKKLLSEESNRLAYEQSVKERNDKVARQNEAWENTSKDCKEKYSEEKVGKDLTFDNVLGKAKELCKGNKALAQAISEAPNPAQTAYNLGLTHPDMAEILKSSASKQVVKDIKDKINQPKPKTTSPQSTPEPVKLSDLPVIDLYTNPKVKIEDLIKEAEKI